VRNSLLAFVSALALLIVGVLIINWQLWHLAQSNTVAMAKNSAQTVESMLNEAAAATVTAQRIAQEGCTSQAQLDLGAEAALKPHLRAIMILDQGQIMCTSLPGNGVLIKALTQLPYARLSLLSGARVKDGLPVLLLQTLTPGGRVIVSISDAHVRSALATVAHDVSLSLRVEDRVLAHSGDVVVQENKPARLSALVSLRYPFSIDYPLPPFFSADRLMQQGWGLILLIVFLSMTIGLILRRYLGKSTTYEDDLRKAIEKGEIVPFYQPIVNGETGVIQGVEVLARWKHPKSGFIPPNVFIPIAEKSGLIIPLTKSLMAQVVSHLNPLSSRLPEGFHIGINISARHITSDSFLGDCSHFHQGFEGKRVKLVLEITEREPLLDSPHLIENLNSLHTKGFVIALDDFGTGYSGLSCLHELRIDYIKIDQSFVSRVSGQKDSTMLLDCVIELARKMSLSIVAEGVETLEQLEYLNRNKIALLQGYYFGKPVSYIEFIKVLLSKPRAMKQDFSPQTKHA
jgi:EAL domain-containing protein (putative c-di-GMP-specific phosphodiesterase class I)